MKSKKNLITGSILGVVPVYMCIERQENGTSNITWHKTAEELRKQQMMKVTRHES